MDRLKASRADRRSLITRYINEVRTILEASPTNLAELASIWDRLMASKAELQQVDAEFEVVAPFEELEPDYLAAAE